MSRLVPQRQACGRTFVLPPGSHLTTPPSASPLLQPAVVLAVWTDEITGLAQCLSRRTVWLLLAYMARVAVKFAVPRLGSLGIAVPMVGFGPGGLWSLCITAVLNGLLYSDLLDLSWAHGVHRAAGGQPLTIGQILF